MKLQNYYNNLNQFLKEQLTGINVNESNNAKTKPIFRLLK